MRKRQVDLYIGGDLGLWALEHVSLDDIKNAITLDESIARALHNHRTNVWLGNANIKDFEPAEIGFSIHYPRLLKQDLIAKYHRLYNLHPGYLPWGRGYYPVFWALWEQTPAGATLHEISAEIDEGPVVAQRKVELFPYDTGGSLFERVREAERELFLEFWPRIVAGEILTSSPQHGTGTHHFKKDFYELKQMSEWSKLDCESLVRLIRALSFPGSTGLEITLGGQHFEVHLSAITKKQSGTEANT